MDKSAFFVCCNRLVVFLPAQSRVKTLHVVACVVQLTKSASRCTSPLRQSLANFVAAVNMSEKSLTPEGDEEFVTLATASSQASQRTKAACKHLATHLLKVNIKYTCIELIGYDEICGFVC